VTFSKSDHGIDVLFEQLIDQRSFVGRAAVRRSPYDTGTSSDVIKEHPETCSANISTHMPVGSALTSGL
jgi:hypothetical protein